MENILEANPIIRTKQQLGAYYTPIFIAQTLTDWAVTNSTDTILDPSFGGCAFLYAALKTFQARDVPYPGKQIFGVDIDLETKNHLSPLFEAGASYDQFLIKNFFEVLPLDFNFQTFNCIVGNPPYINYHNIDKAEQKVALARMKEAGVHVSGRSSSWAFFLIHSLRFLKYGGRMAMVLPSSFVRADYAAEIRETLAKNFRHIYIILLTERIFEDTEEQAVLFLGQGFGEGGCDTNVSILEVGSAEKLHLLLENLETSTGQLNKFNALDNLYHGLLPSNALALLLSLENSRTIIKLGDWVNVRIGVVTGGNNFFIMSRSQKQQYGIQDDYVMPVITRPAQLAGLCLTDHDVKELFKQDKRSLLLAIDAEATIPGAVSSYINNVPDKVRNAAKCIERKPWYSVYHRFNPPSFMQYMSATWPRIVVNKSSATCTNNIHRLLWSTPRPEEDWLRLALGSLTTLSQLSAELVGRSYGRGVLKLEPKEVLKLRFPISAALDLNLVEEVDRHLRQGNTVQATEVVDQQILMKEIGLSKAEVVMLQNVRDYLHQRRRA